MAVANESESIMFGIKRPYNTTKKLNINIIDDVVKMTLEFSDPNLNVSGKTIEQVPTAPMPIQADNNIILIFCVKIAVNIRPTNNPVSIKDKKAT